ncbi:hypothetical protein AVEN_200317-1 [Araneus ventricosus]|uniref:BTB domain-containing protein n=1 Tax=Araneus ventricosus TaxID=182803 RepID=A0A4Y2M2T3_ARAVE|nr:hypothetical protein AVEN_200317-1 [Araneus ventricosus]
MSGLIHIFLYCIKFPSQGVEMVDAVPVHQCCFQWEILNPFLPWRNSEATFYHGSPTVTQWKVIFQPMDRRINYWKFSFSLEFCEWFDHHRCDIVAHSILVDIILNGASISHKEVSNYYLSEVNDYTYYFQEHVFMNHPKDPHQLIIKIEISLTGNATGNEEGNGLENDLRRLSSDLRQLLADPQYSNMNLMATYGFRPIQVHSYIINARWNNFFREHAFEVDTRDTVGINISNGLLSDILTYMYSGTLGIHWPNWRNTAYITELFQVIDRYKLYHLYKVFVKNDLQQVRVTRTPALIDSRLFPLDVVSGRPVISASYAWHVTDADVNFPLMYLIFQIRIRSQNRAGPWLAYSVQSRSRYRVYAHVSLEIMKGRQGRTWSVYEGDCTIDPDETVDSGPVLFLGSPEIFGDFNSTSSAGTDIQYFIRWYINATDGTTINKVRSVDDDILQNEFERFRVLSDHMHKLKKHSVDADMQILSRSEGNGILDEYEYQDRIHKGIFAIRVPEYWEGLENVPRPNELPEIARSTLSNVILPIVLDYIYTGKISPIPAPFLDEVEHFAERTQFSSLRDLVRRIRIQMMNF